MAQNDVTDFMPQYSRYLVVIVDEIQETLVEADLSARQTERVLLGAVEDDELPLRIGNIGDARDLATDRLQALVRPRILGDGGLLLCLFPGLRGHGHEVGVTRRKQLGRALAACDANRADHHRPGPETTDNVAPVHAGQRHDHRLVP